MTARIPSLSRRRTLGLGALTVVAGALTACGQDDRPASAADGGTRTVRHPLGTTQVPAAPQRIAVVDRRGTICHLVSLGVVPSAALTHESIIGAPLPQVLEGRVDDVEVLPTADSIDEPALEALVGARPDLVLGWSEGIEPIYDKLSAIAPTVGIEVDFDDAAVTLRSVARALGRTDDAERVVADFDERLAAAAREVTDPGSVAVLLGVGDGSYRVYEPGSVSICTWLEGFGARIGPTAEALGGESTGIGFVEISEENLPDIDSDTVVLLYNTGSDGDAAVAEIERSPLWARLPAVRAGRVVRLNSQAAVGQFGYPGFEVLLDDLLAQWRAL